MKSNKITKYKKDLISLYKKKLIKIITNIMNMLFDIWNHFNKNDKNINSIDKKWSK